MSITGPSKNTNIDKMLFILSLPQKFVKSIFAEMGLELVSVMRMSVLEDSLAHQFCKKAVKKHFPYLYFKVKTTPAPNWLEVYVGECIFYAKKYLQIPIELILAALRGDKEIIKGSILREKYFSRLWSGIVLNVFPNMIIYKKSLMLWAFMFAAGKPLPEDLSWTTRLSVQKLAIPIMAANGRKAELDQVLHAGQDFDQHILGEAWTAAVYRDEYETAEFLTPFLSVKFFIFVDEAILHAAQSSHPEALKLVLKFPSLYPDALVAAAQAGQINTIRALLDSKKITNFSIYLALHAAQMYEQIEATNLLAHYLHESFDMDMAEKGFGWDHIKWEVMKNAAQRGQLGILAILATHIDGPRLLDFAQTNHLPDVEAWVNSEYCIAPDAILEKTRMLLNAFHFEEDNTLERQFTAQNRYAKTSRFR